MKAKRSASRRLLCGPCAPTGDGEAATPLADENAPPSDLLAARLSGSAPAGGSRLWRPAETEANVFRLLTAESSDAVEGLQIGRFTIRQWLGGGGFGVVYLAEDPLLQRSVALKLPRVQALAQGTFRSRFLREVEAAAQLHHPNVIPLFEAGETAGICYIASQYCQGPTLQRWLKEREGTVPLATAVSLVQKLAEAIEHAHQHHVLHRDLKPSNILLEIGADEKAPPHPLITDFGLAKLLDPMASPGEPTVSLGLLGTPRYMAPEQAVGNLREVGPASDIFSIGTILYELLLGRPPYAGKDQSDTLQKLQQGDMLRPRTERPEIPRDLEAICLKCLEQNPANRYGTAQQLADDLRRFAERRPTIARPVGRPELLRRWTLREPALAGLLFLSLLGILVGLGGLVAYSRSLAAFNTEIQAALHANRLAQQTLATQRQQLSDLLAISKTKLAHQAVAENDLRQASQLLQEIRQTARPFSENFVWRHLWNRVVEAGEVIEATPAGVYDIRFSPTADRFATCGADGVVRLFNGRDLQRLSAFSSGQGETNAVAFSPAGDRLATAGDDGTVRLWNAADATLLRTIPAHPKIAYGSLFTQDGKTVVSWGRDDLIHLWDAETGRQQNTLQGHQRSVEAAVLSPDGKQLATASSDHTARLWNLATGECQQVFHGHEGRVIDVAFSPAGDRLLTGSLDQTLRVWKVADGSCLRVLQHVDPIDSVAYLDGDRYLVAGDRTGALHLWSSDATASSRPLRSWKAHPGRLWTVVANPHGEGLISGGGEGKIIHWEAPFGPTGRPLDHFPGEVQDLTFADDTDHLLWIEASGLLHHWNPHQGHATDASFATTPDTGPPLALSALPDTTLLRLFTNGTCDAYDWKQRERPFAWKELWSPDPSLQLDDVTTSRDGKRIAVFSFEHELTRVYDREAGKEIAQFQAYAQAMALSPEGTLLAMSDGNDIILWDIDRQEPLRRFRGHSSSIPSLRFSPDGRWLASGSKDRQIRLWPVTRRGDPIVLSGHRDEVRALAFSPDGRLLASGGFEGGLRFWHLPTQNELLALQLAERIRCVEFSFQGDYLAALTPTGVHLLNGSRGKSPSAAASQPPAAAPSPLKRANGLKRSLLNSRNFGKVSASSVAFNECMPMNDNVDNVQPIAEVLVPMDFSESSRHALEFAKRIIEASHARLHLLSVDDDPLLIQKGTSQKARDVHEDKMALKFIDCLTPDQRERYHTVMTIKCGTAYHEIEEYARDHAIDLIVIGRVGRSALADVMLGSVAAHVIRHAPCPVVAVRPEHNKLPAPPSREDG